MLHLSDQPCLSQGTGYGVLFLQDVWVQFSFPSEELREASPVEFWPAVLALRKGERPLSLQVLFGKHVCSFCSSIAVNFL